MKISVDVDCTPEEARRFVGLPDLTPVHDVYIEQLKRVASEGVSADMVEQMMRSWSPVGEMGLSLWRQVFEQLGSTKKT